MIRITTRHQSEDEVVRQVIGKLVHREAAILEAEGRRWIAQGKKRVLDFRELQVIQLAGIELLQSGPDVKRTVGKAEWLVRDPLTFDGLADRMLEAPDPGAAPG